MIAFIIANWQAIVASLVAVLGGLIGLFLLIPGEQPEKALQAVLNFLKKFSAK